MAKKKGKVTKVDFSEVTTYDIPDEGVYSVKVDKVTLEQGGKGPYLSWTFTIVGGESKGSKLFHNTSLAPQALFNLKDVLESLGLDVPKGEMNLNLEDYVGLATSVEVSHEVYEGKKRPRIVEFLKDQEDEELDIEDALEELDLAELKVLAKELKIKLKKKDDEESIIEKITDAIDDEDLDEDEVFEAMEELFESDEDDEDDDDEDDDDDDEDDDDDDDIDYEEMTLKELKALAKEEGLKVKKGMKKDDIIEMLEDNE